MIGAGKRVNMTLCFSQEQGAAVYRATKGAKKGRVFISPFVGRLDDIGENGLDLIANTLKMYLTGDKHVQVLSASVRSMEHFLESLELGADIITAPLSILKEWKALGMPLARKEKTPRNLKPIAYKKIPLSKPWTKYNIKHPLTDKGLARFSEDWNKLIK